MQARGEEGESPELSASTGEGENRQEEMGPGKGMFWLLGSPLHFLGLGGREIIKVLSEMRKWSPPQEWLVTPLEPRAQ